jgi:hypothetical protein
MHFKKQKCPLVADAYKLQHIKGTLLHLHCHKLAECRMCCWFMDLRVNWALG